MKINRRRVNASQIQEKYFTCPACKNNTLIDITDSVTRNADVGYHDQFICDECGAEFLSEPQYSGDIKFIRKKVNASADIDLSEYDYVSNVDGYSVYRKVVDQPNGSKKGVWVAQDQDEKNPPFSITYDQARGFDPINDTSGVKKLGKQLGKKLLPNSVRASDDTPWIRKSTCSFSTWLEEEHGMTEEEWEELPEDEANEIYQDYKDTIRIIKKGVFSAEDADEYEDDIQEISQEFTSENTSINSSKLPAIFKMISLEPGTINIDYGGGRFDNVADYLTQFDIINLVYDPYNRTKEHNSEVIRTVRKAGGADTATCSNVLNVIKEPEVRLNVLQNISKLVKPSGTVYITVYEGSGKGDEGPTKSGYQLNRKTADYLEEIQQVFPDATRKGKLIVAHPGKGSVTSAEDLSYDYLTSASEVDAGQLVEPPQSVTDDLIQILDTYGFVLDPRFNTNPGKTWMGSIHLQVIDLESNLPQDDFSALKNFLDESMFDEIHQLGNSTNCPITWSFGVDEEGHVTGGLDIDKQYVEDEDSSSIEGAYYGGAYDIEPDQFFTKDEIVEFGDAVAARFSEEAGVKFTLSDVYMDTPTLLHLVVTDNDFEYFTDVNIDMRRIRKPDDIYKYETEAVVQLEDAYRKYNNLDDIESATSIKDIKTLMKAAVDATTNDDIESVISSLLSVDNKLYMKYSEMQRSGDFSPAALGKKISDDLYYMQSDSEVTSSVSLPSRYWEPGWEDANARMLPEDEWIPEDEELPFDNLDQDIDDVESASNKRISIKDIHDELLDAASKLMRSPEFGFPLSEIAEYLVVEVTPEEDNRIKCEVRAELSYQGMDEMRLALDPIVAKYDKNAYFDHVTGGIIEAWIDTSKFRVVGSSEPSEDDWNEFYDLQEQILSVLNSVGGDLDDFQGDIQHDSDMDDRLILEFDTATDKGGSRFSKKVQKALKDFLKTSRFDSIQEVSCDSKSTPEWAPDNYQSYRVRIVAYGTPKGVTSSEDIKGSWYNIPEPPLDPPEYPEPYDLEDTEDDIEFDFDTDIEIDEIGLDYEDQTLGNNPDDKYGDWYSWEYPSVKIRDGEQVTEDLFDLIDPNLPYAPGKYHISGSASLHYHVSGVQQYPSDSDWEDGEIVTDYVEVTFDRGQSVVTNFQLTSK